MNALLLEPYDGTAGERSGDDLPAEVAARLEVIALGAKRLRQVAGGARFEAGLRQHVERLGWAAVAIVAAVVGWLTLSG